jgi:TonB-dependent receptor
MTPQTNQGTPQDGDFKTALFDVTQGKRTVQWGGLGAFGIASKKHSATLSYLYTRTAEDTATLAEDTRGKAFFDPDGLNPDSAPYLRLETLEYTERTTGTLQLSGRSKVFEGFDVGQGARFRKPEIDWSLSHSSAGLNQPDKRQFGSLWKQSPAFPDGVFLPYLPAANFNYGNFQRIWKDIEEESDQAAVSLTMPFEQEDGDEGYLKFGLFDDQLDREFSQETFSNYGDGGAFFEGGWDEFWSEHWEDEDHAITASEADVDYTGDQDIRAGYGMVEYPLTSYLSVMGGARFESTKLSIVNHPESDALWYPPGATQSESLEPGEADVRFAQDDVLPAVGLELEATKEVTVRAAYSQTVARQTFKELTPILQQEYLGGPVFIGNPDLQMASLENYDLRVDYAPYAGSLVSASWFQKDVEDPIEYVQRLGEFAFTTPVNYPKGELQGIELELRQDLGRFADSLRGFSAGANATFIDSSVTLPADEAAGFDEPQILAPMSSRDMTNAPEHLYNLFLTYDVERTGTQVGLFYTVQGDTLVAGAGEAGGNFVPNVYALEYDSLNLSLAQKLGRFFKLQFQAKNLTNPEIEEVYRSRYIGDDVLKTSYTKGIEYSIGLSADFSF